MLSYFLYDLLDRDIIIVQLKNLKQESILHTLDLGRLRIIEKTTASQKLKHVQRLKMRSLT